MGRGKRENINETLDSLVNAPGKLVDSYYRTPDARFNFRLSPRRVCVSGTDKRKQEKQIRIKYQKNHTPIHGHIKRWKTVFRIFFQRVVYGARETNGGGWGLCTYVTVSTIITTTTAAAIAVVVKTHLDFRPEKTTR